jgi:hypothetical protein
MPKSRSLGEKPTDRVICVNKEPIYAGAFWAEYSSISFNGVVIDTTPVNKDHPIIQLQLDYPDSSFFRGEDPRSNSKIFQSLSERGKLK